MKPNSTILVVALACAFVACSASDDMAPQPDKPLASISAKASEAPASSMVAEPSAPEALASPAPRSEEILVDTVARTLGRRDLKALQALATAEFAADLERMHAQNPSGFWIRASVFVQNVKTGFEVLHRQEDTREQWNIVLRFGNGQEERLTFTREDGKLRIVDL